MNDEASVYRIYRLNGDVGPAISVDFVKETLDFVNRERAAQSMPPLDELPQGLRSHACECPIARALPGDVEISPTEVFLEDGDVILLPECARRFVMAFDAGDLPEFETAE